MQLVSRTGVIYKCNFTLKIDPRLSILNGVFSAGYVAGTSLGGKLYKSYENYYLNFGISIGLGLVGILAGILIKESVRTNPSEAAGRGFFNLENLKESLMTSLKWRANSGTAKLARFAQS